MNMTLTDIFFAGIWLWPVLGLMLAHWICP